MTTATNAVVIAVHREGEKVQTEVRVPTVTEKGKPITRSYWFDGGPKYWTEP